MHKMFDEIMYFVSVRQEGERQARFLFTSAAIEILKKNYVLLNEEVADGLVQKIMETSKDIDICSSAVMTEMISEVETEILCNEFLLQNFPQANISSNRFITYDNTKEFEIYFSAEKPGKKCPLAIKMRSAV